MSRADLAGPSAGPSGSDVWEVVVLMPCLQPPRQMRHNGAPRYRGPGPPRNGPPGAYEKSRRQVSGPG
ncbi:hypothetical protein GCM10010384_24150 [Streptomyces djakartensis]|uniref:Uncharacterized protein n=1 Tax=Streptomyces djakartensis TaxID=68193 RepID=A0ABQ2ZID7_9ACTN|nr:hypothetical protein GCM10010384_24150 [Streptomyces djakartensis]